jgi:hypothetical protein
MQNHDARDALLVGVFFIGYGILAWLAAGGHLPSLPVRRPIIGLDPGLLNLARARRDTLMSQEGVPPSEEHVDA